MLQFRIQSTPNPYARKYVINRSLRSEGKVSYKNLEDCRHVPMGEALLSVAGISQVHFFENVLTVTQDGTMDWPKVDHTVQTIVQQLIDSHDAEFRSSVEQTLEEKRAHMSPELIRIDDILERTIRPGLQADGGDVEPLDYDGMVLTIRYMGACGGCPSSMAGTLEAIKGILRDEFRPDLEVVAV